MTNRLDLLREAAEARDKRQYSRARDKLLQALRESGEDPALLWGLSQVELGLSAIAPDAEDSHGHQAAQWIERAIELDPEWPEFHYFHGVVLVQISPPNYVAAAHAYRRAIEIEPSFAPALMSLAMLHGDPDRVVTLEEAISYCERAIQVNPTRSMWKVLARLYGEAGRMQEKEQALAKGFLDWHEEGTITY